jgi:hypothetical protein
VKWNSRESKYSHRFIDKTTNLDLKNSCHPIGKSGLKPAFSAGSYLTEVFEAADIAVNTQYKTIASEKNCYYRSLCQRFKQ